METNTAIEGMSVEDILAETEIDDVRDANYMNGYAIGKTVLSDQLKPLLIELVKKYDDYDVVTGILDSIIDGIDEVCCSSEIAVLKEKLTNGL